MSSAVAQHGESHSLQTGRVCRGTPVIRVVCIAMLIGCSNTTESPDTGQSRNAGEQSSSSNGRSVQPTVIRFDDITKHCGVHFVPQNGREAGFFTILESLGTGVGIIDVDDDGAPDFIAPGGGTLDSMSNPRGAPTAVFRQSNELKFLDVAATCGIDTGDAYTHGAGVADWNNDGFDDVVITGMRAVKLFQNGGDGTFQDVTAEFGIPQTQWSTSVAFLDADNDGDLELYVVNYVDWSPDPDRTCLVGGHRDICPPGRFTASSDWLFDNSGDGQFQNVSESSGLEPGGKGLAVIAGDIDLDGDSDIYVANDTVANFLYVNDGSGRFEEQALVSGCALGVTMVAEGSMGVDLADFDLDGLPDIWVSNYENQSFAMYQSRAPGIFQHVSTVTGISAVGQMYVGFGTVAFDADLDGDQDIFAANGHVMYQSETAPVRQFPLVYENMEGTRFRNVAQEIGDYGRSRHMGRGMARSDFDGDGLVDLVVAHTNEPISLLRNASNVSGNSAVIRLIGRKSNRSAVGAYVTCGDWVGLRRSGGSYLSDSTKTLTFSIRRADEPAVVEIYWPSGVRQTENIWSNRINSVVEQLATSKKSD